MMNFLKPVKQVSSTFENDSFIVFETVQDDIIWSEDSFSLASLESESNQFENDNFIEVEDIKKTYLQRKNNIKEDCCRRCEESMEDYLLMKIWENQLQMRKRRTNKSNNNHNKKIELN